LRTHLSHGTATCPQISHCSSFNEGLTLTWSPQWACVYVVGVWQEDLITVIHQSTGPAFTETNSSSGETNTTALYIIHEIRPEP